MTRHDDAVDKDRKGLICILSYSSTKVQLSNSIISYDYCCACREYIEDGALRVEMDLGNKVYMTSCYKCFQKAVMSDKELIERYEDYFTRTIEAEINDFKRVIEDFKKKVSNE